ncbi:MAG: YidC/Oxa1 family membrane protein insertase [Acidimicrobiales bacterium]
MASITHTIGSVFQPIFHLFGWLLALFYGVVPNYAVAITVLTILIMGALTPLTIKSTKSMIVMQRLQPEIKKLQQKYKGPENRQLLNEELMRLYREEGANPLGGCLPVLLQAPFLFILYSVIRGLSHLTKAGAAAPRYIPTTSKMYRDLIHSGGQVKAFGMNLSSRPFPVSAHHGWVGSLPFFAFVIVAVGLQYFQMAQINNRNRKSGQAVPSQQLMIQRFMPILFAYIYLVIPAAVVLYMIVSTIIRIITQDLMFRAGVSDPLRNGAKAVERALPAPEPTEIVEEKPPAKPAPRRNPPPPSRKGPATPKPSTRKTNSQPRSRAKRKRKAR